MKGIAFGRSFVRSRGPLTTKAPNVRPLSTRFPQEQGPVSVEDLLRIFMLRGQTPLEPASIRERYNKLAEQEAFPD